MKNFNPVAPPLNLNIELYATKTHTTKGGSLDFVMDLVDCR